MKPETVEKALSKILLEIQSELKAPKGQFNAFGKYNYRSCEDILEAVKPLLAKKNVTLTITDDMILLGNRYYVKATATLENDIFTHKDELYTIQSTAFAREAETKKGMDESQITGAASSYARKYALNGLLLIDDNKDADTQDNTKTKTESQPAYKKPEIVQEPAKKYPPASDTDTRPITEGQIKRFFAIGKSVGWAEDEERELINSFGYEHTKDIQRKHYEKIIEMLENGVADIPHNEKQADLLDKIKTNSDENVKDYELDSLDKKAIEYKKQLHELTGDDIHYGSILADWKIDQPYDIKDKEEKAKFVTALASEVSGLNKGE